MNTASKTRRFAVNKWGIASVLLFAVNYWVGWYSFSLHDSGQTPLFSTTTNYELCVVMQLAASVCGFMAMRRGSPLWMLSVVPSAWLAFTCFLGEL